MNIDGLAAFCLLLALALVGWLAWVYTAYGQEAFELNLLAAAVSAVVSTVVCLVMR